MYHVVVVQEQTMWDLPLGMEVAGLIALRQGMVLQPETGLQERLRVLVVAVLLEDLPEGTTLGVGQMGLLW